MKELDLLVENYFTESFETSDLLRLVEQVMNEQPEIISEGDTSLIDINEIWTAFILAGGWNKVAPDDAEQILLSREEEIKEAYENGEAVIEIQKGRAVAAAEAIKNYAADKFSSPIEKVTWTARPGDLQRAYDPTGREEVSKNNPADILIKFENPEVDSFLGVSLKSTKMPKGVVSFGNFGGNYVYDKKGERNFPYGLSDIGGKEAWDKIKKDYDKQFARANKFTEQWFEDKDMLPTTIKARKKFLKRIRRTWMGEDGLAAELKSVKDGGKNKVADWAKEEPYSINPEIAKSIEKYFYEDTGKIHTQFYRDEVFKILKNLTPKELQEHVLVGLLRTSPLPLTIVATGRGDTPPFTADISENPSTPKWVEDVAVNGFSVEKSGNNIITLRSGKTKEKIVSIRMKFSSRPFAGSVKPTLGK
jgi:hypothetical protein